LSLRIQTMGEDKKDSISRRADAAADTEGHMPWKYGGGRGPEGAIERDSDAPDEWIKRSGAEPDATDNTDGHGWPGYGQDREETEVLPSERDEPDGIWRK
jgi:hypothetical protein